MRILALEHDLLPTTRPDLHDILRAEAAAVWDLQKRGIIREIWFTVPPGRHAIVMLECSGAMEAKSYLDNLPLVRQGLCDFEVLELCPYDGLERLFGAGLVPSAKPQEPPEY